ncbi:MAG: hypothetical protein DRQ24_10925, partial [Candidatus Latescibacterota bacterium]
MSRKAVWIILSSVVIINTMGLYALAQDEDSDKREVLEKELAGKMRKPAVIRIKEKIEKLIPHPVLPAGEIFIREVRVVGSTLLPETEIDEITSSYQNVKIAGKKLQQCADRITSTYWHRGYLTSYAYINTQRLKENILEIQVVEGRVGKIKIKGNTYFTEDLLKRKFGVREGDFFDANIIKKNLYEINKHPDRKVRFSIETTEQQGIVNIVLTVKDRLPVHLTFDADNYGSHYIFYKRYRTVLNLNNLSGRDDSLQLKLQYAESNAHKLYDIDYRIPLNNDLLFQLYVLPYKMEDYGHERDDTDMEKRARKWYFYFYKDLIDRPNCQLTANIGFIYMDIFWYAYYRNVRSDRFRILTGGFDLVRKDKKGTTVLSQIWEVGIPRLWGGSTAKDPTVSVLGAGGEYKKFELIAARRQRLFWDVDFLIKTHLQLSSHTITGVNAFSVGGFFGIIDMRGYPRAQYYGDNGISVNT